MSTAAHREGELYMLALTIWREARNQPFLGQLLVASTILNRQRDPRWPDTITGVVLQHRQFSCYNRGDANSLKFPSPDAESWDHCHRAAMTVLEIGPFTRANHYHRHDLDPWPAWSDPAKEVARVGDHVFLRL